MGGQLCPSGAGGKALTVSGTPGGRERFRTDLGTGARLSPWPRGSLLAVDRVILDDALQTNLHALR